MADLVDRISGLDVTRPKINLHRWMGCQRLYALGELTRAQISTEFDLQGAEATQATQLANAIDAAGNATNKAIYVGRVEAVMYCVEDSSDKIYHNADGTINKPLVYSDILITG